MNPDEIIRMLALTPHPEGGWYRETWRADAADGARPAGTAIYYLLTAGQRSHWHRVDADEIWNFNAGAPLELCIAETSVGPSAAHRLGPDLTNGERPQIVVPAHHWQAARPLGDWTLVSCTVSPGFLFERFEMAPAGFDIPGTGA